MELGFVSSASGKSSCLTRWYTAASFISRAASFFSSLFSASFFHPFNVHVQGKYRVESQVRTGISPSFM